MTSSVSSSVPTQKMDACRFELIRAIQCRYAEKYILDEVLVFLKRDTWTPANGTEKGIFGFISKQACQDAWVYVVFSVTLILYIYTKIAFI